MICQFIKLTNHPVLGRSNAWIISKYLRYPGPGRFLGFPGNVRRQAIRAKSPSKPFHSIPFNFNFPKSTYFSLGVTDWKISTKLVSTAPNIYRTWSLHSKGNVNIWSRWHQIGTDFGADDTHLTKILEPLTPIWFKFRTLKGGYMGPIGGISAWRMKNGPIYIKKMCISYILRIETE